MQAIAKRSKHDRVTHGGSIPSLTDATDIWHTIVLRAMEVTGAWWRTLACLLCTSRTFDSIILMIAKLHIGRQHPSSHANALSGMTHCTTLRDCLFLFRRSREGIYGNHDNASMLVVRFASKEECYEIRRDACYHSTQMGEPCKVHALISTYEKNDKKSQAYEKDNDEEPGEGLLRIICQIEQEQQDFDMHEHGGQRRDECSNGMFCALARYGTDVVTMDLVKMVHANVRSMELMQQMTAEERILSYMANPCMKTFRRVYASTCLWVTVNHAQDESIHTL